MKLIVLRKNCDVCTITTRKCVEKYAKNMPTVQLVQILRKYANLAYFFLGIWIWVYDTGAFHHSTNSDEGMENIQESNTSMIPAHGKPQKQ